MKRISILLCSLLLAHSIAAQPWMPVNKGPQKLDDIIAAHKAQIALEQGDAEEENDKDGKAVKEAKDHLFQKWAWYQRQHLDRDGYIVPTARTWQECQKYMEARKGTAAKATANQSQWEFTGPETSNGGGYYGIGRINVVAFHPSDPNTYWIGSAGGGAWKTTDDGQSWTPMYHDLMALGVADIDYNPLNPNTIYLCTGDRDAGDTYSIGVMKSTDGGASWQSTGLSFNLYDYFLANTLIINPADTNTLLLASDYGIYRSTDAGGNWTNVKNGDFKEIVYCPSNPNVAYAAGSQVFRTADGGQTWQQVTNVSGVNRVSIAVTAVDPSIVKAIFSRDDNSGLRGIYSSSDTGHNFTEVFHVSNCSDNLLSGAKIPDPGTCGGQGWYDLCIAIDPADANKVVIGGINTWYSADGGAHWQLSTEWYDDFTPPFVRTVHADKHYLKYHPLVPGKLFECCDGGIYSTSNPISLFWNDLTNGLGITEFYRNAVADNSAYVLGGSQDNGTKRVRPDGTTQELTGGDGMNCEIDYTDSLTFYTSYQLGSVVRTNDGGQVFLSISDNILGQPGGSWITPFCISPQDHNVIIAGYDMVYYSNDMGGSWLTISNEFQPGHTIDRLALANTDANYIYALVNNKLYYTNNLATSWDSIPVPYPGWISDILVDPLDAAHLWVTFSGYDTVKVADYWPSHGGWANHSELLPNVPASCIIIDTSSQTKYIGTDLGVFYRDVNMNQWGPYNTNLPFVHVSDLGINYSTYDIWAATYGRGMWHSPKNEHPTGISIVPLQADVLTVSPNPNKGSFTVSTGKSTFRNKKAAARLLDANGRTVWHDDVQFDANGHINVQVGNLAKGRYIFEVSGKDVLARANVVIY